MRNKIQMLPFIIFLIVALFSSCDNGELLSESQTTVSTSQPAPSNTTTRVTQAANKHREEEIQRILAEGVSEFEKNIPSMKKALGVDSSKLDISVSTRDHSMVMKYHYKSSDIDIEKTKETMQTTVSEQLFNSILDILQGQAEITDASVILECYKNNGELFYSKKFK